MAQEKTKELKKPEQKKPEQKKPEAQATGKASVQPKPGAAIGEKVDQLKDYFDKSKAELKKITWPSRKETISTSIAVIVMTVVMALYLGLVDMGLAMLIKFILS